jgi:hypothetical protein
MMFHVQSHYTKFQYKNERYRCIKSMAGVLYIRMKGMVRPEASQVVQIRSYF